ncbi:MAG: hypothetical protein ACYSX1_11860, partial [Planctomycetota bacterium]
GNPDGLTALCAPDTFTGVVSSNPYFLITIGTAKFDYGSIVPHGLFLGPRHTHNLTTLGTLAAFASTVVRGTNLLIALGTTKLNHAWDFPFTLSHCMVLSVRFQ